MLNDPRMHRQSTSTNVPPPPQTTHDLNTPPPQGMEGTRNSVSPNSELGIRSMFATYDETPPSAQPWLHTYSQSPNFFEGASATTRLSLLRPQSLHTSIIICCK